MKLMMIFFSSPSAMMNRYSFTQTSFAVFFFFLLLSPIVLSQQLPNQTATMITLNNLLPKRSSPWDITKEPNPCQWKGVNCNGSSVTHLSLSGFSLSSYDFLPIVCEISSLQSLDLSNNHFNSIPLEVFRNNCSGIIDGLKLLNFSKNSLAGPLPDFQIFIGLEHLDLSYNRLNGSVNLQLDELVNLKSLNLSRNRFFGSVPTNLGKSKALENLELSVNSFTGSIPEEIVDYGNLTLVDLSANKLSGDLPARIGKLTRLKILILSSNNLTGEIPIGLSNIATLTRFAANQNNLRGQIPEGTTRFLKNLDISYNRLYGPIPPDLFSYRNLETVDLSYNSLSGSVPVNVSSSLVRLRLGSNSLEGEIPSAMFATVSNLNYLELENNSFTGMIPRRLGGCQNLTLLNLARNKLNGSLPVELGNLSNLQVMRLQLNKLGGMIPNEFFQLHKLSIMNISWNLLNGSIPSSISNLQKLTNLYLQGNSLRGSIPDSIREMGSLLELQLGENQLSGRIPMMPQKLQIALNLSSNLFQGAIPKTLRGLSGLEVLDLSNNKFSGEIPDFLAQQMPSLTQLILSNNQLSGVVPKFDSWVLVNTSGNLGLIQAPPPNPSPELANRRKHVAVTVIISIAAALVAVAVVIVIALLISRRFERVNVEQLQLAEESHLPQVTKGNLLTANAIHKSSINFTKAMEAVANSSNVLLKTRFSTYYKAIMPSGMSYFVKKLNWSDKIFQLGSHEKFDMELKVLGKLSNSNVMTPLAYVLASDSAYLFYEYAPKGTLFDVLHGSLGKNGLDWASRYSIAVGVAQGLAFLHGSNSGPILLLDLSSKTILLKSLKEPQVGDIELCKVIDPSKSTGSLSTVAGSVGYIPPEYAYTMRVTPAGNVYSYGVILLELLTGKPAVSEGTELAKWVLRVSAQQDRWDHILDFSVSRVSVAVRSQMLAVLKVAIACVNVSSEARPKMKSVLRMLLNAR